MAAVPPGQICSRPLSPRHPRRVEEATRRAPAGGRGWRGAGTRGGAGGEPLPTRARRARRKEPDSPGSRRNHGGIHSNNKICGTHVAIMLCPYAASFLSSPLSSTPWHVSPLFVGGSWIPLLSLSVKLLAWFVIFSIAAYSCLTFCTKSL